MPRAAPSRPSGTERLQNLLFSLGLRLGIFLCRVLPRDRVIHMAGRLGGWLGEKIYPYDHQRRRWALKNVKRVLPGRKRKARERLVRGMYRHFGIVAAEHLVVLARNDMRPYGQWISIEGGEAAREAIKRYGSAVFVTCHGGNFELFGGAASEAIAPLHAVMKPVENPVLNKLFIDVREKLGMQLIDKFPALRTIVREIRAGSVVALLVDQRRRNRGLMVDFFGLPAATVDTPAVLAYRYGIPILPGFSYRKGGPFKYEAYFVDPIVPDQSLPRDQEVIRMTQEVNDRIEEFVRAHPRQWNWAQPRWKISDRMRKRSRKREAGRPNP